MPSGIRFVAGAAMPVAGGVDVARVRDRLRGLHIDAELSDLVDVPALAGRGVVVGIGPAGAAAAFAYAAARGRPHVDVANAEAFLAWAKSSQKRTRSSRSSPNPCSRLHSREAQCRRAHDERSTPHWPFPGTGRCHERDRQGRVV